MQLSCSSLVCFSDSFYWMPGGVWWSTFSLLDCFSTGGMGRDGGYVGAWGEGDKAECGRIGA